MSRDIPEGTRHNLSNITEIVETRRLKEIKNFEAREQMAAWRRTHGFDRNDTCVCAVFFAYRLKN